MYIIDRFEGEFVICEDENKEMHQLKRAEIPTDAKEGDCLQQTEMGFVVDADETINRKKRIKKLMSSLFD